jgi:hypothetical protein
MNTAVATIAAPAAPAAAAVAARAAEAVRAIYAGATKTHALLRAARKFHVLAMTAAQNGGFWVSAGGGTARVAARWAKTHPADPAPAPAAPVSEFSPTEFAIGELRRLCPAGETLYVAAADDNAGRPGREWHGSVMAFKDGHVHHLNWLVEDAGIAPRGRLGRLVIRPRAGEDVGERIARIIARALYPGQEAALRHAWV